MALADATVRVILDVSRFDRDLETKVASAARRAGRRFESEFVKTAGPAATRWWRQFDEQARSTLTSRGTRAGAAYGQAVGRGSRPVGRLVGRELGEQIRGGLLQTVDRTGRLYGRNLLVGPLTESGNRIGQRFGRSIVAGIDVGGVGVHVRRRIEDDTGPQMLAAARTVAARFSVALGSALSAASISRFGALVAGVTGLVVEGTQLAAALEPVVQSLGLLPAAASVATASITTLVVAFQGMGDALSAAAEGDAEALAEALEGLAPAAASVVREFAALMPQLSAVRREVQQAFFSQLTGDLTRLGEVLLGPVQRGMTATAAAAGRMYSGLLAAFSEVRSAGAIEEIFLSAARAFDQMNVPLQRMTTGMLDWVRATLPAFDQLIATLGDGAEQFGAFLSSAAASGRAMAWVNEAITTLSQLGRVVQSAGRLIGTIFDAANAAGGNYLTNLNNALIATRQFLAVGEGRTGLVSIFEGIHEVVRALAAPLRAAVVSLGQVSRVAGSVAQALSSGLAAAIRGIGQAIENAGPGLTRFAEAVGAVLADLGDVLPSVGESLGRLLSAAAPLVSAFGLIARAGAALLDLFSSLPGPLLTVIAAFTALRALGVPNLLTQIQGRASGIGGVFSGLTATYAANLASLRAMRIEQQVATNAMSSGIPTVGAFGAAIGGLSDRARAAGSAIGGGLLRGVTSLIGALGGGIGIALTAASVLIGLWAGEQAKADQAVAAHNMRVRQLGSTLDKVTGSITSATRAQAQQSFASSELADAATRLGLSINQVADAATGNSFAQERMLSQLRNSTRGALQAQDAWWQVEQQAKNLGVTTDDLVNAMLGNEQAFQRVSKAAEANGINVNSLHDSYARFVPDQIALGNAINKTSTDLARQADAIQRANALMGPTQRLAQNLADAMGTLADNSSSAADKARALDSALRLLNGGTVELADAQKASADAIANGGERLQQLAEKYAIANKTAVELGISTEDFAKRQADLGKALFDSAGQINFASERARGLYEVSRDLRQATLDQTAAIVDNAQKTGGDLSAAHQRAADLMSQAREQVIQWARSLQFSQQDAERFADSLGLLPDNVKIAFEMENVPAILAELGQIKGDIEVLPDRKSLRLDSNARGMADELADLGFIVEDIPGSKDIKIRPNTEEAAAALRTFIIQQITSRDADLKIGANTDPAKLSAEQIRQFIETLPANVTPGLDTGPVIAEWQHLLLGPLYTQPGTPQITPGVDGAPAQGQLQGLLDGLITPGQPTITPYVDEGPTTSWFNWLYSTYGAQGKPQITPGVNPGPAEGTLEWLTGGIVKPGEPTITPDVDGGPATTWFDWMFDNFSRPGFPLITPGVNSGPAEQKLNELEQPVQPGLPLVTPSVNIKPAQGQIQNLILQVNNTRTTGPIVNGNIAPANAALALLMNLINRSRGNVSVGANTGPAYGSTNSLLGYIGRAGAAVGVGANTGPAYAEVGALVNYINSRVATVTVRTNQQSDIRAAEGGIFKFFAGGGVNSFRNAMRSMPANRAEIVPAKTMRVIGDRARGDEAFIPLVNSARSRAILQTASARMGYDLVPRQQRQRQQTTTSTTTVEAGAIVVNAPYSDPRLVARAVVNELTREAVV